MTLNNTTTYELLLGCPIIKEFPGIDLLYIDILSADGILMRYRWADSDGSWVHGKVTAEALKHEIVQHASESEREYWFEVVNKQSLKSYLKRDIDSLFPYISRIVMNQKHEHRMDKIRKEIGKQLVIDVQSLKKFQEPAIEVTEKKGDVFIASEDREAWFEHCRNDADQAIHIAIPGYATGDRYTIAALLALDDRVRVHVVYDPSRPSSFKFDEREAQESYRLYCRMLRGLGKTTEDKVGLHYVSEVPEQWMKQKPDIYQMHSTWGNAADAIGLWNHNGFRTEILHPVDGLTVPSDAWLYHVSLSTHLIGNAFEKDSEHCTRVLQNAIFRNMILPERCVELDELYQEKYSNIENTIILWVGNRSADPAPREAEAFSHPRHFEQIIEHFKQERIDCLFAADSWTDRRIWGDLRLSDKQQNPLVAFWTDLEGRPREEQWYLMHRIMEKNKAIIGNRSGSLEPLALLGMPVIYLEHQGMYTPERMHYLCGRVPTWKRLLTKDVIGYKAVDSDTTRPNVLESSVTEHHFFKQREAILTQFATIHIDHQQSIENNASLLAKQKEIERMHDIIDSPMLRKQELERMSEYVHEYEESKLHRVMRL